MFNSLSPEPFSSPSQFSISLNQQPRAGRVNSITLQSFLVHLNCKITFGKNLNVIIGANGSGKSAIASALAVALGSTGKRSGRDSARLSEFVREPQSHEEKLPAVVTIELDNNGVNTFEPDTYGETVTIQRYGKGNGSHKVEKIKIPIEQGKGSIFKVLKRHGKQFKLVAAKKSEIAHFRNHFGIDMDNVTVYLNQDHAKKLLKSSTEEQFYHFFHDTLNIDEATDNVHRSLLAAHRANEVLEHWRFIHEKDKRQLEEHHKRVRMHEERLKLKKEATEINRHLCWKNCKEMVKEFSRRMESKLQLEEILELTKKKVEKLEQQIEESKAEEKLYGEKNEERIRQLSEEKESLKDTLEGSLKQTQKNLLDEVKISMNNARKAQNELMKLELKVQSCREETTAEIVSLEQKKDTLEKTISESNKMDELNTTIFNLKHQLEIKKTERENNEAELEEAQADLKEQKQSFESFRNRVTAVPFSELFKGRFLYDPSKIQECISQEKRFSSNPIGPLAEYIHALPSLWNDKNKLKAVEFYLNRYLSYWLVATHQDRALLQTIMRTQTKTLNIPIVVVQDFVNPQPHNVKHLYRRTAEIEYMIDVLDIDNTTVKNFLIDKAKIESVGIFSDFSSMYRSLENSNINISHGCECDSFRWGTRFGGGAGVEIPSQKETKIPPNCNLIRIKKQDSVAQRNAEMKNYAESIKKQQDRIEEIKKIYEIATQAETKIAFRIEELQRQCSRLMKEKRKAEDDLNCLCEDIEELKVKRRKFEEEQAAESAAMEVAVEQQRRIAEEAKELAEKIKKEFDELEQERESVSRRIRQLEDQIKELKNSRKRNTLVKDYEELNETKKQFYSIRNEIQILEKELLVKEEDMNVAENDATLFGEEPDELDERSPNALRKRLTEIDVELAQGEDLTKEQLQASQRELATVQESIETSREGVESAAAQLKKGEEHHQKCCKLLNEAVEFAADKAKLYFNDVMRNIVKFNAVMKFDHKTKKIHFYTRGSSQPTDLSTLSGGERASVQSGFLIALARSSESPIHLFDELDVFMDDVTRENVMTLLFEFAVSDSNRQFIFITPHVEKKPTNLVKKIS